MLRWIVQVLAVIVCCLMGASAYAEVPWHQNVTVTFTAAGWKYAEVWPADRRGWLIGWSGRAASTCTHTAWLPFAVDKASLSGVGTPAANPPTEYRVASKDSQTVVASALEPTWQTSFTSRQSFDGGLGIWLNMTGGTTCTVVVSLWGESP